MIFQNRAAAGKMLAEQLVAYRGRDTVVLALPRGGLPVGKEVSRLLQAPLDIVSVRKIGHPEDAEFAIGAIDDTGAVVLNPIESAGLQRHWLEAEMARQEEEAARRLALYRKGRAALPLAGKLAIVVDDGIATGLTMRLAVEALRAAGAQRVVVAVPVASTSAVRQLRSLGAEMVVLVPPEEFAGSVGAHYVEFEQLGDEEVIRILQDASARSEA